MKRFVSQMLAMMASLAFGIVAYTAGTAPAAAQGAPAPDFGTPPSGEIPILFNDQHVYSKPDRDRKGRVLAALVRGKTILVPLRSMFEQMGATVSYNASTKTVDVSKPGADVQVTVGKPEVVINGETRPLDVPPEIYKGNLVVPLRVISEGMGAYVLWVPDRRLVVVRYLSTPIATQAPATPTPAPVTTTPAPPPATATPTPNKTAPAQFFLVGDALFNPKVYDEFSPGNKGGVSEAGRVGVTFGLNELAFMAEGTFQQFRYPHRSSSPTSFPGCGGGVGFAPIGDTGCVTVLGPANSQAYVPSFDVRTTDIDGRFGIGVFSPKVYLAAAYEDRYNNAGYPRLTGVGGGVEKLEDFSRPVDVYGSIYYFPGISGTYTDIFGNNQKLEYRLLKYQAGLAIGVPRTPLFLDFGYLGEKGNAKQNAPSPFTESSLYGGLGLHF